MKILHINTICEKGGAALLMTTLAQNMERIYGIKNGYIIGRSSFENSDKMLSLNRTDLYLFGQKKLKRILTEKGFQYIYMPSEYYYSVKMVEEFKPDIIHLHNTHGDYFQINLIKKLSKIAPIVWTFHDMFPVTGHCAHSFDCDKWQTGCGKCPYPDTYPQIIKDQTAFLWKYKKFIYNSVDFKIVVPSAWLKSIIEKSFLKNKDIKLIYNGINVEKFIKTEKSVAREKLGLPNNKKIILFSAHGGIRNSFKGGSFAIEVYEKLKNKDDILFLNIGGEEQSNNGNWLNFGYVESEEKMALLYSSADIMLYPTLADNCPLGVVEAMLCGLSVVTFDVGGVPEIVEHDKTGYIAKYKDSGDLLKGVQMLLDDENMREEFGISGEKRAREMFDAKIMAEKYYELYCELLNKKQ